MEDEPLQEPDKCKCPNKRKQKSKQKKKTWKKSWKSCMHKDYFGNQIAKMHYVKHFIVLMTTKKLI
jgi:hypothetical protein